MRIAVYCSSSLAIDPKYIDLAHSLGAAIAARSWELVSGGGHISAMGAEGNGGAKLIGGETWR
jgi:predicted Rossmann-fold nucleotide-binding protein